jgi:DNA polymerase III delta subunit
MPVENALGFLRIVEIAKTLPAAILIAGPQAFLREYLVDAIARRLTREGLQYRTFQIANASDFASVVEELRAPDLFAPKRMLVCRVMRSFRDRGGDENTPADDSTEKETRVSS